MSYDPYFDQFWNDKKEKPLDDKEVEKAKEVVQKTYDSYFDNFWDKKNAEQEPTKAEKTYQAPDLKSKTKIDVNPGLTISDYIFNKYAPESENDSTKYVQNLSQFLDMDVTKVNLYDVDTIALADAIARQEGWYATSETGEKNRPQRNYNPGNLRFANQINAIGEDKDGFAQFKNYEDGIDALYRQIELDKGRYKERAEKDMMSVKSLEGIIPTVNDLHSLEGVNQQKEDYYNELGQDLPKDPTPKDEVGNIDIPYYGYEYNTETMQDDRLGVIDKNGNLVTDERLLKNFFDEPEADQFGMMPPSLRDMYEGQGYRAVNLETGMGMHTKKELDDIVKYEKEVLETNFQERALEAFGDADMNESPYLSGALWGETLKHLGYKTAEWATLGYSNRFIDKPIITSVLDRNLTGIKELDENEWVSSMTFARVMYGIGETSGHMAHFAMALKGASMGLTKLGIQSETLAGAIGFAAPEGISRLADPEKAEHMTARKWLVDTGADAVMGAAFPWLGRLGGEVIATRGSNLKAFFKLLAQSSVLTGGMTGTQFVSKWHTIMEDNPKLTAKEALIQAAGSDEFKLENLMYNMLFMTGMHTIGSYTRFLPGAKGKGTSLQKGRAYQDLSKMSPSQRAKWLKDLSGKERAEVYHWQLKRAKQYADNILKVDAKTGKVVKEFKSPRTVAEAQQIINKSRNAMADLINKGTPVTPKARPQGAGAKQKAEQPAAPKEAVSKEALAIQEAPSKVLERLRGNAAYKSNLLDRMEASQYKVEVLDKNIDSYTETKQVRQYKKDALKELNKQKRDLKLLKNEARKNAEKGVEGAKEDLAAINEMSFNVDNQIRGLQGQKLKSSPYEIREMRRQTKEAKKEETLIEQPEQVEAPVVKTKVPTKKVDKPKSFDTTEGLKAGLKNKKTADSLITNADGVQYKVVQKLAKELGVKPVSRSKDDMMRAIKKELQKEAPIKKVDKPVKNLESKLKDLNQFQNILASEKLQKQVDVYDLMELAQSKGIKVTPEMTKTDALGALFKKMHKEKKVALKVEEQAKIVREKQRGGFKLAEKKMLEDTLTRQKESLKTYKGNQVGREQLENSIKATERLLEFKKVNEKGQSPLAENAKSAAERLGGLEVGFLGMTPQNFKIVGRDLKKGAKRFADIVDPNYTLRQKIDDAGTVGAQFIINGFNNIKDFSKVMTQTFGQSIKAFMKKIWKKAKGLVKGIAEKGVVHLEDWMAKRGLLKYAVEPAKKGTPNIRKVTYEGEPQGVVVLGADMVGRRAGQRFPQGIRYSEEFKGFAVGKNIATQLQKQANAGNNIVAIMGYPNLLNSMKVNPEFQNELKRQLGNAVGKRAFNKLMKEEGGNLQKIAQIVNKEIQIYNKTAVKKKEKINQNEIARWIGEPDASQMAGKIVYVGKLKEQRLGDARKVKHDTYEAEQLFETLVELENKPTIQELVSSMPDRRFKAGKRYWGMDVQQNGLLALKEDSDLARALVETGATGKDAFKAKGDTPVQFASSAIKEMTPEQAAIEMKGERSREFTRFNADTNIALGLKSNTREAVGYTKEWGDENSLVDSYVENVPSKMLEVKGAGVGLLGKQIDVVNFKPNPKGPHKLYKVTIPAKALPEIKETFIELGIDSKSLVRKGQVVDAYVWDYGNLDKKIIEGVADYYGTGYEATKGKFENVSGAENRKQAIKAYIDILARNPKEYAKISKILEQRLPIFYSKKEAQKIIDRIEGRRADYIKNLGGLEAGFMGMTPQNFKLVKNLLVDTGTFTYKQLSKGTQKLGENLGVNADNFKQKFNQYAKDPKSVPAKLKSWFKKVWNQMKAWWKKNERVIRTNPIVETIEKQFDKFSGRMYFAENPTFKETLLRKQKINARIHIIEKQLINDGIMTANTIKDARKSFLKRDTFNITDMSEDLLQSYADGLQKFIRVKARPTTIGRQQVIKPETQDRIFALKENLKGSGEMTDGHYQKIINDLGLPTDGFVNDKLFITEQQGKSLIRKMINYSPIIKNEIKLGKALEDKPLIKGYIDRIDKINTVKYQTQRNKNKVKITDFDELTDMQHYVDLLETRSGKPFGKVWRDLNTKLDKIEHKTDKHLDEMAGMPSFKKVWGNKEIDKEINNYILSKGKGETTLNKDEKAIANKIIKGLKSFENDVRFERVLELHNGGIKDIPDAPREDIKEAMRLLETEGMGALRKFTDTKDWGIIEAYDLREQVTGGKLAEGFVRQAGLSDRHLHARTEQNPQDKGRTQVELYFSYYRRMAKRSQLKREWYAWTNLWSDNYKMFENSERIGNMLGRNMDEMLGRQESQSLLTEYAIGIYSQGARTLFADPTKGLRNLLQNTAINPQFYKLKNLRTLWKGMNDLDRQYFDMHVDISSAMYKEITLQGYERKPFNVNDIESPLMRNTVKIVGGSAKAINTLTLNIIPTANNIADYINVMGRTDKFNRYVAYSIALNTAKMATKGIDITNMTAKDLSRLTNKSGLLMLREPQRKYAMQILATEGKNAFQRWVAKEVTTAVNFEYRRKMRGGPEQGSMAARIMSNLLTFQKGRWANVNNALRLYGEAYRDSKGKNKTPFRDRTAKVFQGNRILWNTFVTANIVGWLYQEVTGSKQNPYNILNINPSVGGLQTGTQTLLGETAYAMQSFITEPDAKKRNINNVINQAEKLADIFIPFYEQTLQFAEGYHDVKDLDKQAMKELYAWIESKYEDWGGEVGIPYKAGVMTKQNREFKDQLRMMMFGTEPEKIKIKPRY